MNMPETTTQPADGIHAMVPRERMSDGARRLRDAYDIVPGAPLYRREFYIWEDAIERWKGEGMPADIPHDQLFLWDPPGSHSMG
ncbi:MAG: hypothetical protein WCL44_09390, partial [bacterium]